MIKESTFGRIKRAVDRGGLAICVFWRITEWPVLQDGLQPPRSRGQFFLCSLLMFHFTLQSGRWQQCIFQLDTSRQPPVPTSQLKRRSSKMEDNGSSLVVVVKHLNGKIWTTSVKNAKKKVGLRRRGKKNATFRV